MGNNPFTDINVFTAIQNGVTALGRIAKSLSTAFPQTTGISSVVPSSVGALTFTSSEPVEFMTIVSSAGNARKIALYNP